MKFYYQDSYPDHLSTCLSKGFYYIQDPQQINWITIDRSKGTVTLFPGTESLYSSISFLSMDYKDATKLLKFSMMLLYSIPATPPELPQFPNTIETQTD